LVHAKARTFKVTDLAPGVVGQNIPADAVAVVGNLTITGPSTSGYASMTTDAEATPTTSTLNLPRGETRANGVIVRLADAGTAAITWTGRTGSSTHAIFDATGYFVKTSQSNGPTGGNFSPSQMGRVVDTRKGLGLAGALRPREPRTFKLPPGVDIRAVAGNLTVTASTGGGYVSIGPVATTHPTTSTINFLTGTTRANNAIVKVSGSRTLSVTYVGPAGTTAHLIFDVTAEMLREPRENELGYVPLQSSRVTDTRVGNGYSGPLRSGVVAGVAAADRSSSDPSRNIPDDPLSILQPVLITGNITLIKPTSAGYLSVPPVPGNFSTSTVNLEAGGTYANGAVIGAPGAGFAMRFTGTTGSSTHVAIDATGWVIGYD
jgi:hypothetical protein